METKNMKVAEVQLIYKSKVKASDRPKISSSEDAFSVLKSHWNFEIIDFIEEFKILLLNRANAVIGVVDISLGSTTGTLVDPKVVFAVALKSACSQIILSHNHPSGNLKPSQSDLELTRKLKAGGELLDITILDHIIISREGYYSLLDGGQI